MLPQDADPRAWVFEYIIEPTEHLKDGAFL